MESKIKIKNSKTEPKARNDGFARTINTRLGAVRYKPEDLFAFDDGLYGFAECENFILTFLPFEGVPDNYRFLQSVERPDLAIIVTNVVVNDKSEAESVNEPITADDLRPHLERNDLRLEDVAVFLVVTLHDEEGRRRVSVNAKAPILLVPSANRGAQVILTNPNRRVNHYL